MPNSSKSVLALNQKWEYVFEESPDKKVRFYIYDASLLEGKSTPERLDLMRDTKNCLSKQKLSQSEIENLNWVIDYFEEN